jgi:fibronectin-binding autotransporter adhesin
MKNTRKGLVSVSAIRGVRRALLLMAAVGVMGAGSGVRADLTWDSGGATPGVPVAGGGNWNLTGMNWSNGVVDAVWPNDGTVADFGAASGAAGTVTLTAAINAGGVTFNPAGSGNYTIAGGTLTLVGATPTLAVNGAISPVISSIVAGTAGLTYGGNGTLTLSGLNTYSGNTQINSGTLTISTISGFGATTNAVTETAGATLNTGTTGTLPYAISISGNGVTGSEGALEDLNGSITYSGAISLGGNARFGGSGHTMTFTNVVPISGGTNSVEFFGDASGNSVWKLGPAASNDAATWGAGMVTSATAGNATLQIGHSNILPAGANLTLNALSTGLAVFDMDGGNSQAVAGLISTGTAANDRVINSAATGTSTLTISPTGNAVFAGAILAGTGSVISVTKAGTGMQTLGGANTYAGNTTINAGTLAVTGSLLATGNVTVNAATLAGTGSVGNVLMNNVGAVVNPGASGAGSVGTLTLSSLTVKGGALQFDLVNAGVASANDAIAVTGATSFTGASTVVPTAGAAPGTYTVLSDAGGITYGAFTPTLVTPSTPAGYRPGATYTLVPNATNIQVVVAGGAAAITWSGAADGTTWDVATTQNWKNAGVADLFFNGDAVTFDDSGAGATVTLNGTVLPGSVTFSNNSANYTIAGSGGIGGAGSVTVNGAGTVTLATTNAYSGGTTISSATVNANAAGALGSGAIVVGSGAQLNINSASFGSGPLTINGGMIDNTTAAAITVTTNNVQTWGGAFTFAGTSSLNLGTGTVTLAADGSVTVNGNTLTVGGAIVNGAGGSNLTKLGNGTLALNGASAYTGTTNIQAGTVLVNNSASLGAVSGGAVTVNGGTLDLGGDLVANTILFGAKLVNIAGTGAGGIGAVTNSGISQFNAFSFLTLTANATISGNRIDIGRSGTGDVLNLGNNTLTLNMTGTAPLFGIEKNASVTSGQIVVAGGTLDIEQTASVLADGVGSTITFNAGTNAQFFLPTAGDITRPMIFNGGNVIGGANATVGTVNSNMVLQGNVTLEALATGIPSLTSNFPLVLAGNIAESGGSFGVTKAGVSTMMLTGANGWSGGTVVSGGTLLVNNTAGSGLGTRNVTLNGGTLGGTGTISGSVVAGAGAHTISPGASGAGSVGTLTIGGLSTNGNTTLALDLGSPSGGSDLLAVMGDVSLGGGTVVVASQGTTGSGSLGYYQVLSYSGNLTGSASGIVLPAVANNIAYTLDTTRDVGFVDVHRGFIGDATDDGTVDVNDLNVVLSNLGTVSSSWTLGNFDGAPTIDLTDLNDVLNHLGTSVGSNSVAGTTAAAPEPGTLGLAALGAAVLWSRRKRR